MSGATPGRILSSRRYPLTLARDRFVAPQVKENSHTFQTDKWIRQGYHRPFGFLQPLRSTSSNQAKHVVTTNQLVKLIATAAIVMSTVSMGLPCFLNSANIIPNRNAAVSSKGQIVSAGRTARGAFMLRSLVPSATRSLMPTARGLSPSFRVQCQPRKGNPVGHWIKNSSMVLSS